MLNKSSYLTSITNMGCTLRMIKYKRGCAYSKYKYTFLFILLFSVQECVDLFKACIKLNMSI